MISYLKISVVYRRMGTGCGQMCTILYEVLRTLGFDTHNVVQEPVSMATGV